MTKPSIVKLVEQLEVTPQPKLPNPNNKNKICYIPLTFLDIPWLLFPPTNPLFFFSFPTSSSVHHLLQTLKLSLSHTLSHFYPLAGTLRLPPPPHSPAILCGGDDSAVSFSVAESDGDFDSLSSHYSHRDAKEFHKLVPKLKPVEDRNDDDENITSVPLMSVQVTVFPSRGFCLGLAIHQVVADGRTFNNFMKVWSSFSTYLMSSALDPIPHSLTVYYDRSVIVDSYGLEGVFLKEWWGRRNRSPSLAGGAKMSNNNEEELVRATFLVGPGDMERVKSWIVTVQLQCNKRSEPQSLYLSPYVLACSLVWVSLLKAQQHAGIVGPAHDPNYFGFIAGGLTRMGYLVPEGYFGNCVGFGRAEAARGDLLGEEGLVVAARAIGSTIKRLDKAVFGRAEKWISEWESLIGSDIHVMVSGSPKVDLYGRDFGVGRPKKIEEVEIDTTKGVSLCESRDVKGGMEFGLVLPMPQMDAFTIFFKEAIKNLSS